MAVLTWGRRVSLLIVLLVASEISADPVAAQMPERSVFRTPATAFIHVGVVPMDDTDRVLLDQTVVVRGARIAVIGPAATIAVPTGATRIDGRGQYLIPGLVDMHVHLGGIFGTAKRMPVVREQLFRYVAEGVTTIRNMNYLGVDSLALRARGLAAMGRLWSPRIYTSGQWHTDGRRSVMQNLLAYQAAGYDFVKVHELRSDYGASLDSLLVAAHLLGLPVAGHVGSIQDSLPHALEAHYASIEHLTGYPGVGIEPGPAPADTARLSALIAATVRAGVWNCPTQAIYDLDDPGHRRREGGMTPEDSLTLAWLQRRRRIIKGLQEAGAGLLLGTDFLAADSGVSGELQALVGAGLTPYQALATGTRNAAAYFGKLRTEGTVAVGKRADLVLLTGNPLADIRHTFHPAGVMLGGRWLSRATLDRYLDTIVASRRAAAAHAGDEEGGAP